MKADTDDGHAGSVPALSNMTVALEGIGAGGLAFTIAAAGILAERYALHEVAFIVPVTALSGACGFAILTAFCGAQIRCLFNPAVAFAHVLNGGLPLTAGMICAAAQIMGAMAGVMTAHFVTGTGLIQNGSLQYAGAGAGVWIGEAAATAGFVLAAVFLQNMGRYLNAIVGGAILLIAAIVTPSLSFANPASTLARSLTETFTSIALADAVIIILIQLAAAASACLLYQRLRQA